jgi:pimeloyl-ACP methyl ester carboxylesterase
MDRGIAMFKISIGFVLALLFLSAPGFAQTVGPQFKSVAIGNGVALHYVEQGKGVPVIFVHGSLSDMGYWKPQVAPFAEHYRVIAYSRRYNVPNDNAPIDGYSAITDSDDLAALIKTLHLGRVYVVGHSYGALTALFLETRHPELLRAVVLAEPPAISLLQHLSSPNTEKGRAMYADIQKNMVAPMKLAFYEGNTDLGVGFFINYVFAKPDAWQKMSTDDKKDTLRNAQEWNVMLPKGTLFPEISPDAVRAIRTPTLILSGAKSYPFLALIDNELAKSIRGSSNVVFPDAGHQMWYKHPDECRMLTEDFFAAHPR